MQWMKRAWRGEERLWKAFFYPLGIMWLLAGIYGGAFGAFGVMAYKEQILNFTTPTPTTGFYLPTITWWQLVSAAVLSFFVAAPLSILQAILVWRCSKNVKSKFWGHMALIFILIMYVWWAVDLVHTGPSQLSAIFGNKEALYRETCQLDMELYTGGGWPKDGKTVTQEYIDEHPFDLKGCVRTFLEKTR